MIKLTTSLNKKAKLKIYRKEDLRSILEHVEAVCDERERANSITWVGWMNEQRERKQDGE